MVIFIAVDIGYFLINIMITILGLIMSRHKIHVDVYCTWLTLSEIGHFLHVMSGYRGFKHFNELSLKANLLPVKIYPGSDCTPSRCSLDTPALWKLDTSWHALWFLRLWKE